VTQYPKYSIVIPAYNESARILAALQSVVACIREHGWSAEVIVVNDGSRDATAEVVRAFARNAPEVRLIENPGNRGKGYSVRHGMLKAQGDWLLFSDADLSTPIAELDKLWAAVERERAQAAIGSRDLDRSLIGVRQPLFREFGGRFFNLVIRLLTGLPFHDTQCGFKLFEGAAAREIFRRQRVERFGFDVEVLFIARGLGYRTLEVPVRWNDVAGTKVKMLGALAAFLDPVKVRWNGLTGKYK